MTEKPIREWTMDEALADVQALAALGSDTQVRSALRVVAKSAIEVAEPLALAAAEIRAFNCSTTKLTKEIITLNRRLLFAGRVIAVATVVGTAVAVIAAVLKFAC